MKNLALLTLCWLLIIDAFAQPKKGVDSLHVALSGLSLQKPSFAKDTTLVRVYCDLAKEYIKLKKDSAIYYLQKALFVSKRGNYKQGLLNTYIQFGRAYAVQFLPAKAIEYWYKALALAEQLKASNETRYILSRLGGTYIIINDYAKALAFYNKYSDLCKANGSAEDYLLSLNNIGVLYFNKKEYGNALRYFNMCDSLNRTVKSAKAQTSALINIGKTEVELKNYDRALEKFKAAINIDDSYIDRTAFVSNEIAKVYLLQNKSSEALRYATSALDNVAETNAEMNGEVAKTLSEIYERLGRWNMAYKYYRQYSNMRLNEDSLKNTQLIRLVQLDYENQKSIERVTKLSLELKEKQASAKLQRLGLLSLLGLVIIIAVYSQSLSNKNKLIESQKADIQKLNSSLENKVEERTKELTIANKELKKKNNEIRAALLKGQTMERERVASELHDNIGGTLSALKWRFEALDRDNLLEKEQKVYDGILKNMHRAYGEIRLISHNMLPAEFEEQGLVGALGKFLSDLDATSSKTTFRLDTTQLHKAIRQEVALEIYICCFETVNNIIKHADATEVVISIEEKANGDLEVRIEDNGKGFSPEYVNNGKGLTNIANRVKKINAKLKIDSKVDKGAKVSIRVPELLWEEVEFS